MRFVLLLAVISTAVSCTESPGLPELTIELSDRRSDGWSTSPQHTQEIAANLRVPVAPPADLPVTTLMEAGPCTVVEAAQYDEPPPSSRTGDVCGDVGDITVHGGLAPVVVPNRCDGERSFPSIEDDELSLFALGDQVTVDIAGGADVAAATLAARLPSGFDPADEAWDYLVRIRSYPVTWTPGNADEIELILATYDRVEFASREIRCRVPDTGYYEISVDLLALLHFQIGPVATLRRSVAVDQPGLSLRATAEVVVSIAELR